MKCIKRMNAKFDKNSMKTSKIIHSMNLNAELVKKFNLTPKFALDFDRLLSMCYGKRIPFLPVV